MTVELTLEVDLSEVTSLLTEIRDRLPAPSAVADAAKEATLEQAKHYGRSHALATMLGIVSGWVEGARSNHEASDHRGESSGSECWRSFTPQDIRAMINDAAREVGVTEWPAPTMPAEDQP